MITVSLDSRDFQKKFNGLLSNIKNPRRIMTAVGKQAAKELSENFVRGGVNEKWKPNSDATVRAKKLRGKGNYKKNGSLNAKPLIDTSNLMKIRSQVTYGGNAVLVGSNMEYGKYHLPSEKTQHESKGKVPVRDWLGFTKEAENNILDVAKEVIENSMK